jgi:hydroxyacylglutathione hydrolase
MAHINVRGPRILGGLPTLYPLSPREVWARAQRGSAVIDTRSPDEYAAAHVPRAYSIYLGGSFSSWAGWLLDEGKRIALVADDDPESREEMVRQLVRIGYDELDGYLDGGMDAWRRARLPVAAIQAMTPQELYPLLEGGGGPVPLDVRFDYEWQAGHVPNAVHFELGELPERAGSLSPDRRYAAICASGIRSATAASVLEQAGLKDVILVSGGTSAWREAGYPLET